MGNNRAKADEREMRQLQKIMADLPKTEYTHSVVLLYEMLAARNPDVVVKLAGSNLIGFFKRSYKRHRNPFTF